MTDQRHTPPCFQSRRRRAPRQAVVIITLAVLAGGSTVTNGATVSVGPPGEADYQTIREGAAAAASGDTVLILPGTYTGIGNRNVDIGPRELTFRSRDGLGSVTIDCLDLGRAFYVSDRPGASAVLEGLDIFDGGSNYGGAIKAVNGDLRISDCAFRSCRAFSSAGVIYAEHANVIIEDCRFSGGDAQYCGGAIYATGGTCEVRGSTFGSNQATRGGALYLEGAVSTVEGSVFEDKAGRTGRRPV